LSTPEGSQTYLLCRSFKKLPSELDEEDIFNINFLLEGLEQEKVIIKEKKAEIEQQSHIPGRG